MAFARLGACVLALLAAGCATRPPDMRIGEADTTAGYRVDTRLERVIRNDPETLLLVAFSGGGARRGVLVWRAGRVATHARGHRGQKARMLDQVDAISSVSGGSFTALAYALYGERLFEVFEPRFLKRNVEQALIGDLINPFNWPAMAFGSFTRSDLAARYYDEILFDGATFGDLIGKPGPLVVASSTEFSSGYRFTFTQNTYDLICSNLRRHACRWPQRRRQRFRWRSRR
jgi:NTE family protein